MSHTNGAQQGVIADLARRFGVTDDAVQTLVRAVQSSGGWAAQFSHPQLGGMGQWTRGGMIMIGDMFNNGLKAHVAQLCEEISRLVLDGTLAIPERGGSGFAAPSAWWPGELGSPASTGGQNSMRYAFFPDSRRLVIDQNGYTTIYDTADHQLSGFSQQQGGNQSLTFSSQYGYVSVDSLRQVANAADAATAQPTQNTAPTQYAHPTPMQMPSAPFAPTQDGTDHYAHLEKLHDLHRKGILTDDEYAAKKKDVLQRI